MGRPVFVRLAVAGLTLATVAMAAAPSIAADIQVFTSGAPSAVQKRLAPTFTKATGHNVVITAETINLILKRLEGNAGLEGDAGPDVVVIPRPVLAKFEKSGALRPGSMVDVARVGIGVVVKEGSLLPDISTADALRKMLLNAKSIAHPDPKGGGFTGAHIDRMFERLGIADAVRPKVRLGFAFAGGVDSVAKGEVELGLFNISEIVPAKGVTLVGPLPAEHQNYLVFAGALHVRGVSPGPAAAYLRALVEPGADAAWNAGGMEAIGSDGALTGSVRDRAGNRDRPAE
jgi:molybdate transport system substrate-binding protein